MPSLAHSVGAVPPHNGLGGKLVVRILPLGGRGKALMLIAFLRVFPFELTPGATRCLGSVVLETCIDGDGDFDDDGALSPDFGRLEISDL